MADASFARLAYDAAVAGLEKQEHVLDELRSRTGLLLAASSLSASFLGPTALDHGQPVLLAGALAAFAVSIGGFRRAAVALGAEVILLFGAVSDTLVW